MLVTLITPSSASTKEKGSPQAEELVRAGLDFLRQRKHGRATALFRQALALRPTWTEVHNHLGLALGGGGQDAEALVCFEEALRLEPHSVSAQFNRANALRRLGRLQDAVVAFEEALRLDPTATDACNNLGITLLALG